MIRKQRKKDPIRAIEIIVVLLSFILSIFAFSTSISSNNKANKISEQQFMMERENNVEQKKEKSINNINSTYDKIMYTQDIYDMWAIISEGKLIEGKTKIRLLIDEIEGLGDKYCKQQIYKKDLDTIKGLLEKICTQHQIVDIFKGQKNGFSKICLDVIGEKGMGGFYQEKNDCNILN